MADKENISTNKGLADPVITSREQLKDPRVYEQFAEETERIVREDDREEAIEGRYVLEEILLEKYPQLETEAPELSSKYQRLVVLLKFVTLSVRPLPEVEELIREHLTTAVRIKIDLRAKFQDVLTVYHDITMGGRIAEKLANAMLASSERLGKDELKIKGKDYPVPPTIANYLTDYRLATLPPPGTYKRVDSLERINYIDRGENVKQLPEESRKMLLKILELYDWLRFGPPGQVIQLGVSELEETEEGAPRPRSSLIQPSAPRSRPQPPVIKKELPQPPRPVRKPEEDESEPPVPGGGLPKARPAGAPRGADYGKLPLNERLYRSTLDELRRQRAEHEKPKLQASEPAASFTPPPPREEPKAKPPAAPSEPQEAKLGPEEPLPKFKPERPSDPVSVNEAIIREDAGRGTGEPAPVFGDKEIEERLKNLEKKMKKDKEDT